MKDKIDQLILALLEQALGKDLSDADMVQYERKLKLLTEARGR